MVLCESGAEEVKNCLCRPDGILDGICCANPPCPDFWSWAGLAGVAIMVSAVILAFLYMWASIFRDNNLNTYVKQELYELVVTIILVVFLYSAVAAMSDITINFFLPPGLYPEDVPGSTTIYEAAAMYFQQLDTDMAVWLQENYIINMYIDQIASVTPYARPLGVGLVASPLAGLASPIKQLLYNMSVALSVAFIMNYAQLAVYIFSIYGLLNYYLPIGIFLRAFTPTRRLGGTLIGIAVAFLFVFPTLYTLTYGMFYNKDAGPLVTFKTMVRGYVDDVFWLDRSEQLDPFKYGFTINDDGTFIERKNAGWCGTPPISYDNFEGTWEAVSDSLLEITVGYWGGTMTYQIRIVSLDGDNLAIRYLYAEDRAQAR